MRRTTLKTLAALGAATMLNPAKAKGAMGEPRLLGSWVSDKEKTLALWRFRPNTPVESQERVAALFGNLRLSFSPGEVRALTGTHETVKPYRVVAADFRSVVIEYQADGRSLLEQLFFEGEYVYKFTGYNIEYFRRTEA
jgi:hypothetical protein